MKEASDIDLEKENEKVIFVVPVKGRVETLSRFLSIWTELAKEDTKLGLFVSIFGDDHSSAQLINRSSSNITWAAYLGRYRTDEECMFYRKK